MTSVAASAFRVCVLRRATGTREQHTAVMSILQVQPFGFSTACAHISLCTPLQAKVDMR